MGDRHRSEVGRSRIRVHRGRYPIADRRFLVPGFGERGLLPADHQVGRANAAIPNDGDLHPAGVPIATHPAGVPIATHPVDESEDRDRC
jgi:hypothetical protein